MMHMQCDGIVQTTNRDGSENYSGKKIPRRKACRFDPDHSHQIHKTPIKNPDVVTLQQLKTC